MKLALSCSPSICWFVCVFVRYNFDDAADPILRTYENYASFCVCCSAQYGVIYFCHMLQAECSTKLIIFKIKVMKLFFLFVTSVDMHFWQQTTGNITVDCCLVSITRWSKQVYFYWLVFFFSPVFFARLSKQAAAPLSFSNCSVSAWHLLSVFWSVMDAGNMCRGWILWSTVG